MAPARSGGQGVYAATAVFEPASFSNAHWVVIFAH
jgi:hypothetical protein